MQDKGAPAPEMVERVARVMVGRQLGKPPSEVSDKAWMLYVGRARAALGASHHAEALALLREARSYVDLSLADAIDALFAKLGEER